MRVAVLGGGCAGMAAAEALTATPEMRRRFEVRVIQPGHRLGGKGATGRNPRHGHRIEEHGLHVWMGFYRRAFGMMRRVLEEWNRDAPIRRIEDAFAPSHAITLLGSTPATSGGLDRWDIVLPPQPGRPWDDDGAGSQFPDDRFVRSLAEWIRTLPGHLGALAGAHADGRRRRRVLARLGASIARGIGRDVIAGGGRGFDHLDGQDLREWLRRHGAEPRDVHDCPLVRGLYNLAFAYPDGAHGDGEGAVAAGAGLRSMLLVLAAYRGAPLWRMRAGMGDTIFAPMYEVLRERGVRFDFFRRVEALRMSDDGAIGAVDLRVQARPRGRYEPLVEVRRQPCWPTEPRWEQLDRVHSPHGDAVRLVRGRDFDEVVLAIPAPAQPQIAAELIERSPRYRRMIENTTSVGTAAMQLWLAAGARELGWLGRAPMITGIPGLFGTWGDMSETLCTEAWAGPTPRSVAYFCDACRDATDSSSLRDAARAWADAELTKLWPGARDAGRLRESLLVGGWESQYLRLNLAPSERYVLSLPGSTANRLAPDETGVPNLVLAGDWTRTRINGGSVEAAVESGQRAADAIVRRA